MRRFVLKLFIGAAPVLAFFAAVEHHCRTRTVIAVKKAYYEANAATAEILLLGDSHSNINIDPAGISRPAVSLSLGGQPLSIDYYLLRQVVNNMPRLNTVVLEVSPHRFYYDLDPGNWNAHLYRVMYGIRYRTEGFSWKNHSLVLAHHKHCVTLFLNYLGLYGPYYPIAANGFVPGDSCSRFYHLGYDSIKIAATFSMRHKFRSNGIVDTNARFLDSALALCKTRGIDVVLLSAPLYRTYAHGLPAAVSSRVQQIVAGAARRYHVSWYDYSNDSAFTVRDFKDDDHLNPIGAGKLTKMLDNRLRADPR